MHYFIMLQYILKRILLLGPTLLGIMGANFLITQMAPGGPVEQMIAQMQGLETTASHYFGGVREGEDLGRLGAHVISENSQALYQGSSGLSPKMIQDIEKLYGFDKPPWERFLLMIQNYLMFDLGDSYFRSGRVIDLILDRIPVSLSLGLWSTLLIYIISIPLGIRKAVRDGSIFDIWTSIVLVVGYAIPGFLFAILLIILFAGGSFWSWFPLRGLTSPGWDGLNWIEKCSDYAWHMVLPLTVQVIGGGANLPLLIKNSFLEEIYKPYVVTARSKGLSERAILRNHIFRNAMLVVIVSIPSTLVRLFFTGSLLIEVIFSLDGLGLLGFEAAMTRDYPVIFGILYVLTLFGLLIHLVGDVLYTVMDPRIHFGKPWG